MSEELKIKVGVDLSAVGDAAGKIPDMVEREARRKNRPRLKQDQLKIWDEVAGRWSRVEQPPIPGLPVNRRPPSFNQYRQPIGPGLPGMPGTFFGYDKPIGPGLPGMPGQRPVNEWADTFNGRLMSALEKSVLRMVVPVHLFNRLTNFIISGIQQMFDRASSIYAASRSSGMSGEDVQKLAYAAKMAGMKVEDLYVALDNANIRLGTAVLKGGDAAVALQRLGITIDQVRTRAATTRTVMLRLADMYQDQSQRAYAASIGFSIFGDDFKKMIPLLSKGSAEINRLGSKANVMSDSTVIHMEKTKRTIDNAWDWTVVSLSKVFDFFTAGTTDMLSRFMTSFGILFDNLDQTQKDKINKMTIREKLDVMSRTSGEQSIIDKNLTPAATRQEGETLEQWQRRMEVYLKQLSQSPYVSDNKKKEISDILAAIPRYVVEKTGQPGILSGSLPMATSLQAMGGGDVLSAIQRNPMDDIARNTAETAANTAVMAGQSKESSTQTPPQPIITR